MDPSTNNNNQNPNITAQPPANPANVPAPAPQMSAPVEWPDQHHITGSQLTPHRDRLPIGIYLIAGYSLVGLGLSFFDGADTNIIYVFAMVLNLFVGVGLLARINAARVAAVVLSILTVIVSLLVIAGLALLLHQADQNKIAVKEKLAEIDQRTTVSDSQRQAIERTMAELEVKEKETRAIVNKAYLVQGLNAAAYTAVAIYLMRPKVRAAFTKTKSEL